MVVEEIKALKELLDVGAITEEEFAEKKKELLNQPLTVRQPACQGASSSSATSNTSGSEDSAPYNKMCIAGIAVGGASLLINLFCITGIVGIVLSLIGLSSSAKNGERGRGLAIAGIVMGAASVLMTVFALALI